MKTVEKEIQKYNDKFKQMKDSIKDVKAEANAKVEEILQREQEIRTANMKLAKLQSDKEDLLNAYGNGIL